MTRTARAAAIAAAAALLLAACGGNSDPAAETTAADAEVEVSAEEESGAVDENPEGAPMDDGGDDTAFETEAGDVVDDDGNLVGIEFGDGEQIEFDLDAAASGAIAPGTRFYGASEAGGDFIISTQIDPVEDLEAYREKAGGDPVNYMSADIDNREGAENINMYQIAVYDPAGNEYVYTSADEAADEWRDLLGSDDVDTYNEGIDLSNKYLNQGASPHQRSTMILTGPELPAEITAVIAMPRGAFESATTVPLKD